MAASGTIWLIFFTLVNSSQISPDPSNRSPAPTTEPMGRVGSRKDSERTTIPITVINDTKIGTIGLSILKRTLPTRIFSLLGINNMMVNAARASPT